MELTQARLKELLHYDPETGVFTWKVDRGVCKCKGSQAGYVDSLGYVKIKLDYKKMPAHRLAWLYVYGVWPYIVDHVNRDRVDNRICNLRDCSSAENSYNRSLASTSSTGYTGVAYRPDKSRSNPYHSCIVKGGKKRHLGSFASAEEASNAYKKAKDELHTFT